MRLKSIDLFKPIRGPDGNVNEFFSEDRGYELTSDSLGVWIRVKNTNRARFVSWSFGIVCTPYDEDVPKSAPVSAATNKPKKRDDAEQNETAQ